MPCTVENVLEFLKRYYLMPLKKKILIAVMLLASALFLYQGFSLLFHPDENSKVEKTIH